jgi:hypothetical protein
VGIRASSERLPYGPEPAQKRAGIRACRLCGAELDVDGNHVPNVIVSVEDGDRVLVVDGTAIHRCCINTTP